MSNGEKIRPVRSRPPQGGRSHSPEARATSNGMRIQKYLSQQGILSRREAEAYIRQGWIKLNGKVVREMGVQVDPSKDKVEVVKPGGSLKGKKTLAFNKPRGLATEEIPAFSPQFSGLNAVGRLDKESEGLILLSNDGPVTKAVTGDEHLTEKEYEVGVQEDIQLGKIRRMEEGVVLEDGMTMPAKAERLSAHSFSLIIREGRRHQIRRMCDALRLTVVSLRRVRIGSVKIGKLKAGESRSLTERELSELKEALRK